MGTRARTPADAGRLVERRRPEPRLEVGRRWLGVACAAAMVACSGGERASRGGAGSDSQPSGSAGAPAVPAADTHAMGDTVSQQSSGATAAGSAQAADRDSARKGGKSRAEELAGAPRADPNAPPKPRIEPDTNPPGGQPKDTGETQPSQQLHDKYHPAPKDTVSQVVYTGWKYFNLNCARCHGEDVTGTTIAPHLIDSFKSGKVDHAEFWRVVHGSRAQKGMPNWSGIIDDDKLQAIYQYIKGRSEGKLHPGRPAVQSG